jgi:hypothetical protein
MCGEPTQWSEDSITLVYTWQILSSRDLTAAKWEDTATDVAARRAQEGDTWQIRAVFGWTFAWNSVIISPFARSHRRERGT